MMLHNQQGTGSRLQDVCGAISIATYAGANLARPALFITRQKSPQRPTRARPSAARLPAYPVLPISVAISAASGGVYLPLSGNLKSPGQSQISRGERIMLGELIN